MQEIGNTRPTSVHSETCHAALSNTNLPLAISSDLKQLSIFPSLSYLSWYFLEGSL